MSEFTPHHTAVEEEPWQRFVRLLGPFHDAAAATARRLERSVSDGDDLFHEAILRAFEKLPLLRDEASFRSWFYAVMLSVHRTRARKQFWKRFRSLDREDGWEAAGTPVPGVDHAAARRAATALATLPAVQREAIVLFDIEGFTLQEVADIQGASLSAVKTRLARGREKVRAWYVVRGWAPASAAPSRDATAGERLPAGDSSPLTEGSAS